MSILLRLVSVSDFVARSSSDLVLLHIFQKILTCGTTL